MNSISARLALSFTLFALIVAIVEFGIESYTDLRRSLSDINSNIENVLQSNKKTASQTVFDLDSLNGQKLLDGFSAYPFINQGVIYDELGNEFARYKTESSSNSATLWLTQLLNLNIINEYQVTLSSQGFNGELGVLKILIDFDQALQPFYQRTSSMMTKNILQTLFIFIVIYLITYVFVTKPLVHIVDSLYKVQGAKSQLRIDTPKVHKKTEIGELVKVFNEVFERKAKVENELATLNLQLEKRVLQRTQELEDANKKLTLLATQDPLTKLNNRRHFFHLAAENFKLFKRYKRALTVIMLDIDNFKSINDIYGHKVGDDALLSCAQSCRTVLRATDIIGRIGGEEFAIILPETTQEDAFLLAERMRLGVPKDALLLEQNIQMTISMGLYQLHQDIVDISSALELADKALYQAKNNGRDQIVVYAKI